MKPRSFHIISLLISLISLVKLSEFKEHVQVCGLGMFFGTDRNPDTNEIMNFHHKVYCSPSCDKVVATTAATQKQQLMRTNYPFGSSMKIISAPFKMETGPPHDLL